MNSPNSERHITLIAIATILLCMFSLNGCAVIGKRGEYKLSGGTDLENTMLAVTGNDRMEAKVHVDGHPPSFGLMGILVPIIPLYMWQSEMQITVTVTPKIKDATFVLGALHVGTDSGQIEPSEIRESFGCKGAPTDRVYQSEWMTPRKITDECVFYYNFKSRPQGEFKVLIDGFPIINVETVYVSKGGFGIPRISF